RAPDPGTLSGYRWPLANGVITSPFGPSPYGALIVDGARFHDGIDIASFCGDKVIAAHGGRVLAAGRRFDAWIGWIGSLGPHERRMDKLGIRGQLPITVIIDDGDGYRAIYSHFNAVTVKAGQYVRAGQQIGWEGATGFATGCHLHFGLFSPLDGRRLELRPDIHRRTKYPRYEIARIDPLLVLPALPAGKTTGPFPSASPPLTPAVAAPERDSLPRRP
ncbi:MAG: M23 family metallopeptidase, partial [Chloroflexota bacterium]|nr:M23 family metallopeptidase [Chloroflexota bacterium]